MVNIGERTDFKFNLEDSSGNIDDDNNNDNGKLSSKMLSLSNFSEIKLKNSIKWIFIINVMLTSFKIKEPNKRLTTLLT